MEERRLLSVNAPSALVATPNSSPGATGGMLLAWADNSLNETAFKVERMEGAAGTYSEVASLDANATEYLDPNVVAGTPYFYRLRATDGTVYSPYSNEFAATEWSSANVGSVTGGSWNTTNGVTGVTTKGNGIGGTVDDFRFSYRSLTGDGQIVARVASVQYTNPGAKAGVMFRDGLAANAKNVLMAITPGAGAHFQARRSTGGGTDPWTYPGVAPAYWVKLVRDGSLFSGYTSPDGQTWTLRNQVNVSMGATLNVGLALASSGYGADNTSTFDNVTVTRTDHSLPSGWGSGDVGSAPFAGSSRYYGGSTFEFAVEASGDNVGGTADTFHFAHKTVFGDSEIVARVASMAGQDGGYVYAGAKGGIMFRDGTGGGGAGARNVFLAVTGGGSAVWQSRSTAGGNTDSATSAGKAAPYWVKVVRSGDTFTGYTSPDGGAWTQIGSPVTIAGMSDRLEAGLALSAAGYGNLNTTRFEHVSVSPSGDGLAATYFDNKDFTGTTVARTDPVVKFHLEEDEAPAPQLAATTFGAEWKGQVLAPETGTYTFATYADDGVRLWIDDELVIDNWDVQSPTTAEGQIALAAGVRYNLRLEYFQNYGEADVQLSWIVPGSTGAVTLPTDNLFSTGNTAAAPATPTNPATPGTTADQNTITWDPVVGAEFYVVYRSESGAPGTFEEVATRAAGLNGYTDTGVVAGATYTYHVVAVAAGGRSAPVALTVVTPGLPPPQAVAAAAAPVFSLPTATVTGWRVRVTWAEPPNSQEYSYRVARRVYGGGSEFVTLGVVAADSTWFDDAGGGLVAGTTYEYAVYARGTSLTSPQATATVTIPTTAAAGQGLVAEYFANESLSGVPVAGDRSAVDLNGGTAAPALGVPRDGFSAAFTGRVQAPAAGDYSFHVVADGGVRLWVNGQLLADGWADVPRLMGDATLDGVVDSEDLRTVYTHLGEPGGWERGDFDGDGMVRFGDYQILEVNFGTRAVPKTVPAAPATTLAEGAYADVRVEYRDSHARGSVELWWTRPYGAGTVTQIVPVTQLSPVPPPQTVEYSVASPASVLEGARTTLTLTSVGAAGQDEVIAWVARSGGLEEWFGVENARAEFTWPDESATDLAVWALGASGVFYRATVAGTGGTMNTLPITVANAAPVVTAPPAEPLSAGQLLLLSVPFTDGGAADTHTATVNWGDGSPAEAMRVLDSGGRGRASASHAYAAAGTYTVAVTVTDNDGASTVRTFTRTVTNSAPVVSAPPTTAQTITEGDEAIVNLDFTDLDPYDDQTATIDWGDGSPIETAAVYVAGGKGKILATHPYLQNGSYTATVTLADGTGAAPAASVPVTVVNAAPRVDPGAFVYRAAAGTAVNLYGSFFDAGELDAHTYLWEVRDAANQLVHSATTADATFTPPAAGTYRATFTVTDDAGASGSATSRVLVGLAGDPPDQSVPPAPSGSAVGTVATDGVTISWQDNAGDEDGYVVEWSPGGSDWYVIDAVPENATSYTDPYPLVNSVNQYRVRAYRDEQESEPTAAVSATPYTATVAPDDDNAGFNERDTGSPHATRHDTGLVGNVFGNDIDFANLPYAVGDPGARSTDQGGSVTIDAFGQFTYTPPDGFVGTDSFTYTVDNGRAVSPPVTVAVDVTNARPQADGRDLSVAAFGTGPSLGVTGTLTGGDVDGDALTYQVVRAPQFGTLDLDPDTGTFTYTAGPSWNGFDHFTFAVSDGLGAALPEGGALPALVTVSGDPPAWQNYGTWLAHDGTAELNHEELGGWGDEVRLVAGPIQGQVTTDGSSWYYTPPSGYVGYASVVFEHVYRFEHGGQTFTLTSKPFTWRIGVLAPFQPIPTVGPTWHSPGPDRVVIPLSATSVTAYSAEQTGLLTYFPGGKVKLVESPQHGKLTLLPNGALTYVPETGGDFRGWDYFAFRYVGDKLNTGLNWIALNVGDESGLTARTPVLGAERLPADYDGVEQAYEEALARGAAAAVAAEAVGALLSQVKNLPAGELPGESVMDQIDAAHEQLTKAYDAYLQAQNAVTAKAGEFMNSIWFTSEKRGELLRKVMALPVKFGGIEPTREQLKKWGEALNDFAKGADVMVRQNSKLVEYAENARTALNYAQMFTGAGAILTTGGRLIAQRACAELMKYAAQTVFNVAAGMAVNAYGTQAAMWLARQAGYEPDEAYVRAAMEGVELLLFIRGARARAKAARAKCFVAGTEVLAGSADRSGVFSERKIEDVRAGDLVWARDDNKPDGPLVLRRVVRTFKSLATDLQTVSVTDASGNTEVLHVTDGHPFYVAGAGWTNAEDLRPGQRLSSPDGSARTVVASTDDQRPGGVWVYNFEVEGSHTYFVADGAGVDSYTWVHNTGCGDPHLQQMLKSDDRTFRRWLRAMEGRAAQTGGTQGVRSDAELRAIFDRLRTDGWTWPRGVEENWMGGPHINIYPPDGGPDIHLPVPAGFVL